MLEIGKVPDITINWSEFQVYSSNGNSNAAVFVNDFSSAFLYIPPSQAHHGNVD